MTSIFVCMYVCMGQIDFRDYFGNTRENHGLLKTYVASETYCLVINFVTR